MEEFSTTFLLDLKIAEAFGIKAVVDTLERCFAEWRDQYQYGTSLCICCNVLCWQHYEAGNNELSQLYANWYYKVREYCLDHYTGEEWQYFFRMTD